MVLAAPPVNVPRELAGLVRGVASFARSLGDKRAPAVTPQSVLVLPGMLTGDGSTAAMRHFLRRRGHRVFGWGLGLNGGDMHKLVPLVRRRLAELFERVGERVHLVGWSLGGLLAREAIRLDPSKVASLVTLGTPLTGGPKYTVAAGWYRHARGLNLSHVEQEVARKLMERLPVPVSVLYSKRDAVVAWRACLDPNPHNDVEHFEVDATHAGMGFDRQVLRLVAERLEQG